MWRVKAKMSCNRKSFTTALAFDTPFLGRTCERLRRCNCDTPHIGRKAFKKVSNQFE